MGANNRRVKKEDYIDKRYGLLVVTDIQHLENRTYAICNCDCGSIHKVTLSNLRTGSTTSCGCKLGRERKVKYINTTYGRLTIKDIIAIGISPRRSSYAICDCICGTTDHQTKLCDLIKGRIQSCGCLNRELSAIRGKESSIARCKRNAVGQLSRSRLNDISQCAKKRGLSFDLSAEYLWHLFLEQMGRCALSNQLITLELSKETNYGTASLDRIDSSKGYIEDNVQWVHKDINNMKMSLTQDRFIELCNLVAEHSD